MRSPARCSCAEMARPRTSGAKKILRSYQERDALLTVAAIAALWPVMRDGRAVARRRCNRSARGALPVARQTRPEVALPDPSRAEAHAGYFVSPWASKAPSNYNYSSDIDLIVVFDRERSKLAGDGDLQSFSCPLSRDLVRSWRSHARWLRVPNGLRCVRMREHASPRFDGGAPATMKRGAELGARGLIKARAWRGDTSRQIFWTNYAVRCGASIWITPLMPMVHAMKRRSTPQWIGDPSILRHNVKLAVGES